MEAIRLDTPPASRANSAKIEESTTPVATTKVGRPARSTVKPKATPFYLHPAVKEVLREISYHERIKEHDLFVEGLEHVLRSRAKPTIAEIIAKAENS